MTLIRRALLALVLTCGLLPAFAQAPAPVPALPDTERRTSYVISGTTCACAVNFALYGDSTDFQNWVEVWINNVRYDFNDASHGWTITSPSGSLGTLARPVTNAVLTFNAVQTGTVQIVGARRPRRTSQFTENAGVSARNLNQVITDLVAQNRETWDKINDFTGRGFFAPPGQTGGVVSGPLSGIISGPASTVSGDFACWNGTSGAALSDCGSGAAAIRFTQNGTGAQSITFDTIFRAKIVTPEMFKSTATCDGTDDGPAIQRAVTYAGTIAGEVRLAPCQYTVVTPIVDAAGVMLVGSSHKGSTIFFAPTADGIAYRVRNAGNIVTYGGIRNVRFSTSDTTFTKTAIELEDISQYKIENVLIQATGGFWTGGTGSIGLRARGREFYWVRNFTAVADKPLVISDNPNSTIDIDHSAFSNLYLTANGFPNITLETGVNFTHVSFSDVACVAGTYCFDFNDTTSIAASFGLSFHNVGMEQGSNPAAYNYRINSLSGVYGLSFGGYQTFDGARHGMFLRNVVGATINGNFVFDGSAAKQCFDTNNTVNGLSWDNAEWLTCSLTNFLGQGIVSAGATPGGRVLPRHAAYASTAGSTTNVVTSTTYNGSSSGAAVVSPQAAAGTPAIVWPTTSGTVPTTATAPIFLNATTGVISFDNTAWTTYTPTITGQTGSCGACNVTATGRSKTIGKTVHTEADVTITNIGSWGGQVIIALPTAAAAARYAGICYEYTTTGKSGAGFISTSSTTMNSRDAAAGSWWVNGYTLMCSATYEIP